VAVLQDVVDAEDRAAAEHDELAPTLRAQNWHSISKLAFHLSKLAFHLKLAPKLAFHLQ
jgi:hypothetical protein